MNRFEEVHHNSRIAREKHHWQRASKDDPDWYLNSSLWKERHHHSDKLRPVEAITCQNLYVLAMVKNGSYRVNLTPLEKEVSDCMALYKKKRSGYDEIHYVNQTALRLKMPIFQIRSILADIGHVKRHYAALEAVISGDVQPVADTA